MLRKVCVFILGFLMLAIVVFGAFRLATYGNPPEGQGLFPDFPKIYSFFDSAPNGVVMVRELIADISNTWHKLVLNAGEISSWDDFWAVVGMFFQLIGNAIYLVIRFVGLPFEYIAWFFGEGYSLLAYDTVK